MKKHTQRRVPVVPKRSLLNTPELLKTVRSDHLLDIHVGDRVRIYCETDMSVVGEVVAAVGMVLMVDILGERHYVPSYCATAVRRGIPPSRYEDLGTTDAPPQPIG